MQNIVLARRIRYTFCMAITFDDKNGVFLLQTPNSTYTIYLYDGRYLLHGSWTRRLSTWSGVCALPTIYRVFAPVPESVHGKSNFSLDAQCLEYPVASHSDFRSPAVQVLGDDGTLALDLEYRTHRVLAGKPSLAGLPATYVSEAREADTLEIELADAASGVVVTLCYTVWNDRDVICRHAVIKNEAASGSVQIKSAMSASVDFWGGEWRMVQLVGAWGRERHVVARTVEQGVQGVSSRRGASSAQANPFVALADAAATEESGDVYGFNLVYSGNFTAQVEQDQFNVNRVQIGMHGFSWQLDAGASFCTPEAVMVYSAQGFGGMSRIYHDLYRSRLCRGDWKERARPIVINNWEATYFNFTAEKLFALADVASRAGIELFVLDDGWFGHRDNDTSSLGDWYVYQKRLPEGLAAIADGMHARGLLFGLWFEPEMVSPDSDLYRAHPDWALGIQGRERSLGRNQLVLDLSRDEVVDYLAETLSGVLSSARIDYVKWDFNRSLSEIASSALLPQEQLSVPHRYYLGLYRLLETLTSRFPHILFESCSSGGGRFDPAMFYYMPQAWTSDNTDALSRVPVQMGTSLVYPASFMSCHVSAVPNHQVGRITALSERAHVAMAGTFGYELDLTRLSEEDCAAIAVQTAWYKKIRMLVLSGELYRLHTMWRFGAQNCSQSECEEYSAWCVVAKDKKQALLTLVWTLAETNAPFVRVRLQGLESSARYKITSMAQDAGIKAPAPECIGCTVSAEELMYAGLPLMSRPEFGGSIQLLLEQV